MSVTQTFAQPNVPTITPFLWFDNNATEAVAFYEEVFGRRERKASQPRQQAGPKRTGSTGIEFELNGQRFMALNGGPLFKFNEAVSFFISCETQEEIDYFWDALTEGGSPGRCGWLKDKFGLSWQVVPRSLGSFMGRGHAAEAMMGMSKLDIAALQAAAER